MFDYSLSHWATFLGAAALLEVVPGPDMAFILGQTVRRGRSAGFVAMLGVWSGALCHIAMTVVGVAAVLASSPMAFAAIKWLGAGYLVWLGLRSLLRPADAGDADADGNGDRTPTAHLRAGRWAIFRQGMIVDLLNPKSALFFVAFIPQFVVPGAGPVAAQLLLHGLLLIVVAAFVEPAYILITAAAAQRFQVRARTARWLDRGVAAMFIGLGLRLAMIQR